MNLCKDGQRDTACPLLNIHDSSTISTIASIKPHILETVKGAKGTLPWMIKELMDPLIKYRDEQ
jgi:hypothetical protein